jgi:3-phenylpropionate/trans-cinnamate dioxygenase ferredoxin reductase subunit
LRLNRRITSLDREAHQVTTADNETIGYDKLILALGSRVRQLTLPGVELAGIHYVRSIADVEAIRADIAHSKHLAIVGAGYIGLEVAAVCRQQGLHVTVIEMADRVMSRVVSPNVSDFYQLEHTTQGVKLLLSTGVLAFHGRKRVKSIETDNEQKITADTAIIGVGIQPNTELAETAGLEVNDGIVVNDQCQTADPDIYAIGDCTSHPNSIFDQRLRLESVHNAVEQAKTAASNLCGNEMHYSQVPWFWSDQYDLKLQIAGLSQGYDEVVLRGDPASRSFSCLYLKNGVLIAVDAINAPKEFVQSKALIANRIVCDAQQLADASVALRDLG